MLAIDSAHMAEQESGQLRELVRTNDIVLVSAIGALLGLGVTTLWRDRATAGARAMLAAALALTVGWSWYLLAQTTWQPWLRYTWVAAAVGSNNAAGYQLATREPVMAVGGFNGTDPAPTLAQFQAHVAAGDIHYYIASSSMASTTSGGSDDANEISEWVAANFTATTVDGTTVYDLTAS